MFSTTETAELGPFCDTYKLCDPWKMVEKHCSGVSIGVFFSKQRFFYLFLGCIPILLPPTCATTAVMSTESTCSCRMYIAGAS